MRTANQAHKRKLQRNRQCLRNAVGDRCVVGAIGAKVALNKADHEVAVLHKHRIIQAMLFTILNDLSF